MTDSGGGIEIADHMHASINSLSTSRGESLTAPSNTTRSTRQPGGSPTVNKLEISTFLKWVARIIAILLMMAVFVFAVLSKTAFVAIASRLYIANTSTECQNNIELVRQRSVAFVQLMLALCVPQVITALRTLFFGVLKANENFPWPTVKACIIGFGVCVVESVALSAFTMLVVTKLDPGTALLLVPGIFTLTAFINMASSGCMKCKKCKGNGYTPIEEQDNEPQGTPSITEKAWRTIQLLLDHRLTCAFGFAMQVLGLLTFMIYLCIRGNAYIMTGITALACGVSLSIVWSSWIQQKIFAAPKDHTNASSNPTFHAIPHPGSPQYPASRKAGFLYSVIRLVLIPCFTAIFMVVLQDAVEHDIDTVPKCWNWYQGFTSWMAEEALVFATQVLCGLGTYFFALAALWSTYQPLSFTVPLLFATPASVGWYWISQIKEINNLVTFPFASSYIQPYSYFNNQPEISGHLAAILFVLLFFSQAITLGSYIWRRPKVPVSREQTLLLSPYYDGIFLDSFLLLNRLNGYRSQISRRASGFLNLPEMGSIYDQSHTSNTVFVCSTMYHERENEMKKMLKSIYGLASAWKSEIDMSVKQDEDRDESRNVPYFESHIFFDDAVSGKQMNSYALQLLSLLEEELHIEVGKVRKMKTPYGFQLHWMVEKMPFYIHLKDSSKIKKKKRWSQVMYMEYIIKQCSSERSKFDIDNTYILTTDADIEFTTESVAALLDFLVRDDKVGAVCARTHPLGSGPTVWYQKFEYAFGHWFQKSAEHVLGCVLCCPGCFSMFRVKALEEVLPDYKSIVTSASEFLTKDMGEDRWLCTLLIKKGWRLEYAALAQNWTYCPDSFEEFYNQRRRWIPSTLANLFEVVRSASTITTHNDSISYIFILYQLVLIFSTAVAPATVILIVSSGLQTAYGLNAYVSTGILSFVAIAYGLICLYTPEKFQLTVAKVLTFLLAIVMAVAFVGLFTGAVEAIPGVSDYNKPHWLKPTLPHNFTNSSEANADKKKNVYLASLPNTENPYAIPISLDSIYLLGFSFMVIVAALMNINEFSDLLHFVWYILGIPSGYMLLIIYSACNLNTRSWGTRVDPTTESKERHKLAVAWDLFVHRAKDCFQRCLRRKPEAGPVTDDIEHTACEPAVEVTFAVMDDDLKDWLRTLKCERYIDNFEGHGYTRKAFVYGMELEDLQAIGVAKKGFQLRLIKAIKELPAPELDNRVAKDVPEFLANLHLGEYEALFEAEGYLFARDVDNLLHLTESDLLKMGITKRGHVKQLTSGLKRLKYPSSRELKMRNTKAVMDNSLTVDLLHVSEKKFWKDLVNRSQDSPGILKPEEAHLNQETDVLKKKLDDLRNNTVVAMLMINIIWVAMVLSFQIPALEQWGIKQSAFPVLFLVIYFVVLVVQFLALIVHRVETLLQFLARANISRKKRWEWYHWNSPEATMTSTLSQSQSPA